MLAKSKGKEAERVMKGGGKYVKYIVRKDGTGCVPPGGVPFCWQIWLAPLLPKGVFVPPSCAPNQRRPASSGQPLPLLSVKQVYVLCGCVRLSMLIIKCAYKSHCHVYSYHEGELSGDGCLLLLQSSARNLIQDRANGECGCQKDFFFILLQQTS